MQWSEFGPYVLPYVIGCPNPVMEAHARLAAIKFCTETKCWTKRLDPFDTDGTHTLEIDALSESARILDFDMVEVNGVVWPLLDAETGIRQAHADDGKSFCYAEDMSALRIYPLQVARTPVVVRAALVPTRQATMLADVLEEHVEAISYGAVASIMRIPGQEFSSASSQEFEAMFRERIRAESSRLARGRIAVTERAIPSFM